MVRLFLFYSFLCFVFVISLCFSSSFEHHICSPNEAKALLKFKQSFIISNYSQCLIGYPKTTSWNESRDCCSWDGVTCDMLTGHVIDLELSCSKLGGSIHPNSSLFQLHHLHTLNLAYNDFNYSSIPNDIGRLTNLRHLNLSQSYFSGKIPTEISYLSNLVSLDLSYRDLYGLQLDQRTFERMLHNFTNLEVLSLPGVNISSPIPLNISSSSLRYVDLTDTHLEGILSESFFLLPDLESLNLGGNDLLKGVLPKLHPNNTLLELDISYIGISGELSDSIGTFGSLNFLGLYGCQLSGSIPDSVGNLTEIRKLDLGGNRFTGHIPDSIGNLTEIRVLYLDGNRFTGHIPDSIGNLTEIRKLDLGGNRFTGNIPDSIGNLTEIRELYLGGNRFIGHIPDSIGHLTEIRVLYLGGNRFTGHIPDSIGNLTEIRKLDLGGNRFTGNIPDSIGNLTEIRELYLGGNRFTGHIPDSIGNLTEIRELYLGGNCFTGHIPDSIGHLTEIRVIKGNDIELEKISRIMTVIDLSSNHFEGAIPKTLMDLGSLWLLNLSNNNLTGDIPMELGKLNMLEALDLSWNRLTGKIPQELTRLTFLEKLNLSQNLLVGPIPHGPQFKTFENDSYGGNLDLCGTPLSKQCETSDTSHVPQPLESEEEDDESFFFSGFTWESMVIGYSFGLVVGTVMWSLMFKYRKPKWIVEFFELKALFLRKGEGQRRAGRDEGHNGILKD